MSTFAPSRLLVMLAFVPGVLAGLAVLATLVLLTVDGHPEGLLAAAFGAVIPVMLWYARRLLQLARSVRQPRPTRQAVLTISPVPTSDVQWPPTGTIFYPAMLKTHFGK